MTTLNTDGKKLRLLADWLDYLHTKPQFSHWISKEVQQDLRAMSLRLDSLDSYIKDTDELPTEQTNIS